MGDAQILSGRQGEAERAACLGRVRVLRSVRVYCLPLFTRPAAPRLATRVGIVQVDTNHPRAIIIRPKGSLGYVLFMR